MRTNERGEVITMTEQEMIDALRLLCVLFISGTGFIVLAAFAWATWNLLKD